MNKIHIVVNIADNSIKKAFKDPEKAEKFAKDSYRDLGMYGLEIYTVKSVEVIE